MSKTQSFNQNIEGDFTIMPGSLEMILALRASRQHYLQLRMDGCWLSALVEYPLYHPHPGWAEQNPADWWQGTLEAISWLLYRMEQKLGIHSEDDGGLVCLADARVVLLDENAQVLRPSIIWAISALMSSALDD